MKVSVIIPSLNPDNKLVAVVDALLEEGFTNTDLHIPDNFPAMVFNNSFILHASPD